MVNRFIPGRVNSRQRAGTGTAAKSALPLLYKQRLKECQELDKIFPLDAPGIPSFPANSAFIDWVQAYGDSEATVQMQPAVEGGKKELVLTPSLLLSSHVQSALREPGYNLKVEIGPMRKKLANFVVGHLWARSPSGPRPADIMIINKMPWADEVEQGRTLCGPDGKLLLAGLKAAKAKGFADAYVTNLVKFQPPNWQTVLKRVWVKDCLPLLWQEFKIVQPKYILCLGGDVSKTLLGPKATVGSMEGQVAEFTYNIGYGPKEVGEQFERTAKVMTVVHPKQVIRDQSAERQLEHGLARFSALTSGVTIGGKENVDHQWICDAYELEYKLLEIENDPEKPDKVIAVDAEWNGDHPANAGSYVRTIQIAWKPNHAIGIKLWEAGGSINAGFADAYGEGLNPKVVELLKTFFNGGECDSLLSSQYGTKNKFSRKRVVGHFFNADLEWLIALGIDIRASFACPLYDYQMPESGESQTARSRHYSKLGFEPGQFVPAWFRTKYEGGADTGLMAHAIEETASYKLETLAVRYTTCPRYDKDLQDWKDSFCKERGIKSKDMEGYGECPDDVLLPYGIYDADVTLRLFYAFDPLLDEDYQQNSCRESFWESQIAAPAVLDIHRNGMLIDKGRVDHLSTAFSEAKDELEHKLRECILWPDFNVRSPIQVKELLYGTDLNGKLDKSTGKPVRVRPADSPSLALQPLFDTSKPPKRWGDIVRLKKQGEHNPSTDKQTLAILASQHAGTNTGDIINMVRDYRFLDQVLKTVLRPPEVDEDSAEVIKDDDGYFSYKDGLISTACDDGKVRTHIYQTKETGRWSSARPNLQNISKQRDPDYIRLLGDKYCYSLRSVLKASPGHVLVEADYIGAELFGMAIMAGDKNMIQHAMRNQLPDSHPDHYDIHSNVACKAFNLKCPPTKKGLADIGMKHIRIVAKSVIFGIAYGRGAKAIATAARAQKETENMTVHEAQAIVDAVFAMYPKLAPFFTECRARATGKDLQAEAPLEFNCLSNCFGRWRRFGDSSSDEALAAEFSRQAMNFPIKSMIASAVSRAIAYLHDYKIKNLDSEGKPMYRLLLQIHDAILFEVPYRHVAEFCETVLPSVMRETVPIYPTDLDGVETGEGPFYLGLEGDVMDHWGEVLSYEKASSIGLPTGTGEVPGCIVNYSKPKPKD